MKRERPVLWIQWISKTRKHGEKKKPLALISTPPKSLKKTAAQRVKIFLLQEEKGWLLSSNSGLFTDIFSWGAKGAEPESRGGGAPVLKRLACHSLPNFGINHLWLGWLCVDGMTARKAGGSERKGEIKCTIVCLDTLEQSGIYCTSSTA